MVISDIILTTPKRLMEQAAEEARWCREMIEGGGFAYYFRSFRNRPKELGIGSRIYYIEDGFIRGFGTTESVAEGDMFCEVSQKSWGDGYHAIMPAQNWKWIDPIVRKGSQGWSYFRTPRSEITIVGDWLTSKPVVK